MSKKFLKFLILTLSIIISLSATQPVKAQQPPDDKLKNITYEAINPGSPNYVFKRLSEKFKLAVFYRQKDQRAKYLSKLLEKRYKELAYLVIHDEIGPLEKAVNRYNTVAGEILEKYKNVDPNLKEQIKGYADILEILRDKYKANSAQWLLMQYTVDTTKRL